MKSDTSPIFSTRALACSFGLCFAAGLTLSACSKASTTPEAEAPSDASTAPAEDTAATPTEAAEPGQMASDTTPWADLDASARMARMKQVVMPTAKSLFGKPDANCTLCHGPGAKEGNFAMPSQALPALDPTDSFAAHDPGAVQFMMEKVVPQIAGALVTPPYDPATHQGFGCFSCHTQKTG